MDPFALLLPQTFGNLRMDKTLKQLFRDLPVRSFSAKPHFRPANLCTDSRRASTGSLFFALPGARADGHDFAHDAILRGAAVVVSEKNLSLPSRIGQIVVDNIREVLAEVARRYYGEPDKGLEIIGITGTNGKTTVSTLLKHLVDPEGSACGLIGTVAYQLGRRSLPASRTTPAPVELFGMFAQIRDANCSRVVMEVSSHGIDQKRVWKVPFKVAAFLNLTQDHLDYHQSMEAYFSSKRALFIGGTGTVPELAVVNIDDAWGRRLVQELPGDVQSLTFGEHPEAHFQASDLRLRHTHTTFTLRTPDGQHCDVISPLPGRYNVSNVLAALALSSALGLPLATALERLKAFAGVPGRMETIDQGQDFQVFIDYAHTDDALRNALTMLRDITPGRVLTVFGCGGDRDRSKRPLMMRAALDLSDAVWATADNPRREPLERIFADMREGLHAGENPAFIEDRRRAIHLALAAARPGDSVLIAGKGHESYQEFADTVVPFDDRQVARELLQLLSLNEPPPGS